MPIAMIDLGDMDRAEVLEAAIEIGLLWWFFYVVLRFLHGTRGLAIMKGVLVAITSLVLGIIVVAQTLDLNFSRLSVAGGYLLQFMAMLLIVMFKPELRRGFTRLSEGAGRGAGIGAVPGGAIALLGLGAITIGGCSEYCIPEAIAIGGGGMLAIAGALVGAGTGAAITSGQRHHIFQARRV